MVRKRGSRTEDGNDAENIVPPDNWAFAGVTRLMPIFFYPLLSVANWVLLLRRGGVVDVLRFGGMLQGGEVAGFGADFAVCGFAGPGAGAVVAGLVDAGCWLRPMFGFFHRHKMRWREEGGRRVFIPWLMPPGVANLTRYAIPQYDQRRCGPGE